MPVQVSVALLAAQAQAVHPLDRHHLGNRPGNPVHHALQRQVLLLAQPAYPVFDVALGSDDAVAQQRRPPGQERGSIADAVRVVPVLVHGADPLVTWSYTSTRAGRWRISPLLPQTRQGQAQHGRCGHRGSEGAYRPGGGRVLDKQAGDQWRQRR